MHTARQSIGELRPWQRSGILCRFRDMEISDRQNSPSENTWPNHAKHEQHIVSKKIRTAQKPELKRMRQMIANEKWCN